MTISRRDILKYGLGSVAFSFSVGQMWGLASQAAKLAPRQIGKSKILIVVQLSGGNDGLNTVVPYSSEQYYKLRPTIAVPQEKVLTLNQEVGLHPSMEGLHSLFRNGKVAVIQAVGYPDENRSHFRSIEIWQTADPTKVADTGWLGRYLDNCQLGKDNVFPAVNVDPMLPKTLFSSRVNVPTVANINDFRKQADQLLKKDRSIQNESFNSNHVAFGNAKYPRSSFGSSMKFISQMIKGGLNCSIYGASLEGFDTHTNQARQQENLLKQLSDGIAGLYSDLAEHGLENDVILMTFSEFGRRVTENSGRGTDHGTAEPMFVVGGAVKGGVYGDHAPLGDLDNGDLKYQIDFRAVYGCLLERWLDSDSKAVLGRRFENMDFV